MIFHDLIWHNIIPQQPRSPNIALPVKVMPSDEKNTRLKIIKKQKLTTRQRKLSLDYLFLHQKAHNTSFYKIIKSLSFFGTIQHLFDKICIYFKITSLAYIYYLVCKHK